LINQYKNEEKKYEKINNEEKNNEEMNNDERILQEDINNEEIINNKEPEKVIKLDENTRDQYKNAISGILVEWIINKNKGKDKDEKWDNFREFLYQKNYKIKSSTSRIYLRVNLDKYKTLSKKDYERELKRKLSYFDDNLLIAAYNYINPVKAGTGLKTTYDLGRFYLDKNKFDNGLFELRYKKNKHLGQIKPMHLTNDMKKIVNDMIHKKSFELNDYHKLNNFDKNTIRLLNEKFGLGININSDDSLDKRFDIIRGEITAGNSNLALKKEARSYLIHAMKTGKLPRNVCYDIMMEMDL
jgi:hypothetical protein